MAQLFFEDFASRPEEEKKHFRTRSLADAGDSDPDDSGLESILREGD